MLILTALACCVLITGAPISLKTDGALETEVRRSEEVSFGNEQNFGLDLPDHVEQSRASEENDVSKPDSNKDEERSETSDNAMTDESDIEQKASNLDKNIADKASEENNEEKENEDKKEVIKDIKASDIESKAVAKRSVPLMSESNMKEMDQFQKRSKRDLSYEELQQLFSDQPESGDDYGLKYPYNEKISPDDLYPDYSEESSNYGDPFGNEEEGFLEATPSKEEAVEKELVRYEVLRELVAKKEEEEEKEEVLDWLIAAANQRLKEAIEEEKEAEFEENLAEEAWLEHQLARKNKGHLEKRYPYSYEPYGKYSAMVPGIKRSQPPNWVNYDRLYDLARALNDNERNSDYK